MTFKKFYLFIIIFCVSQTYLYAETPYFLDFKLILNESVAGKKAQSFLKNKLETGIKNIKKKEKQIQEEENNNSTKNYIC